MTKRYNIHSILLERYDAVYIETPKVACTSVKTVIARILGISLAETHGDPHQVHWPMPNQAHSRSGSLFPGLFAFAFVRNPWDRLVSCYRDKIRGEVDGYTSFTSRPGVANCLARFDAFYAGMSFDEFVLAVESIPDEEADEHFRSQYTFVTDLCRARWSVEQGLSGPLKRAAAQPQAVSGAQSQSGDREILV